MAKSTALELLQQFSSDARQARGADSDDTPAVGGSVVAGGSGTVGGSGHQPLTSHQVSARRGRDSDDDYQPVHDDYGDSSDGSGDEGFSDQEMR